MDNVLQKIRDQARADIFLDLDYRKHVSGLRIANCDALRFYEQLINRMAEKNRDFMTLFEGKHGELIDINKVLNADWSNKFKPLTYHDIKVVWDLLCVKHEGEFKNKESDAELQKFEVDLRSL